MKNFFFQLLPLTLLLLAPWAPNCQAAEIPSTLQNILSAAEPDEEIPVIIEFRNKVRRSAFSTLDMKSRKKALLNELRRRADLDQASLLNVLKKNSKRKQRSLWIINGLATTVTPAEIDSIISRPEVLEVRYDTPLYFSEDPPPASSAVRWNLESVGADQLWAAGVFGQGVVIASMDTGVDYRHNQLRDNWRGGPNSWFDPHGEHALPYDADGHGTQVMGIMAARNTGETPIGMAPLAQWIAVKIFDDQGRALISDIHAGFQWLLDPDGNPGTDDSPHIVNNSWGLPSTRDTCYTEFSNDVDLLRNMGIAVVFAAGNLGAGPSSISPANYTNVFSVGAVDENWSITDFSSQGPSACSDTAIFPTAVAPGYLVNTTDLTLNGAFPDSTALTSGTSVAAPHVSGALALLLSYDRDASPESLEAALVQTTRDLGPSGDDTAYGNGLIDVAQAFTFLTGVPLSCTDLDQDGFFMEAGCGTDVDCNDDAPAIYPGATEIVLDGIDQDCNRFDLSIAVTTALYRSEKDKLIIFATSTLKRRAKLKVDIPGIGVKELKWNSVRKRWQKRIRNASLKGLQADPATTLTVFGKEGSMDQVLTVE
jgi:serine protease AprX